MRPKAKEASIDIVYNNKTKSVTLIESDATVFGLYSVALFFLALSSHIMKLKSFGLPYVSPASPYRIRDWNDYPVRAPLTWMNYRPNMLPVQNQVRKKK
ncbi:spore germination protein [Paenibacillus popilliae]|uniref:Uncharacterized protein n=1 Tax=Paenibacillus popilliae ATCC 14706 TaxID=1212764 RepID=M9LY73_PAEPP|nr:spore germination protein [Paenibacillus popilliae]GAC41034.1 hypothetical protein PPOP_0374 [Paenibacillus popilliae ATCC 14706]